MNRVKKIGILYLLILGGILAGCGKVSISAKLVEVELGEAASTNILDYIDVETQLEETIKKEAELDLSEVNTMNVGEYYAKVTYLEQEILIPVRVVDTTPPVIQTKKIEYITGDEVSANDLVEVADLSKVNLSIDNEGVELETIILKPGISFIIKAVDVHGNESLVKIEPNIVDPLGENLSVDRVYDSSWDIPYTKMTFIDNNTYEFIKRAYANVDWYSEFETGDLTQYDFYKGKYKELVDNEVTFLMPESREELYLNELSVIKNYDNKLKEDVYDKYVFDYYLFDMDGDNLPELCISEIGVILIFKYDLEEQKIILWKEIKGSYALNGSRTLRWQNSSEKVFYKLDEKGNEVCIVCFLIKAGVYNEETGQDEIVYLVTLPKYGEKDMQNEIAKEIAQQGYYTREESIYYFRVTEEQLVELTENYYEARQAALQGLKEVTYTYEGLFGED